MKVVAAETWRRLAADGVTGDSLRARRAIADENGRLFAALDADGRRHLLVQIEAAETDFEDRQSRGVSVTTREFTMPGQTPGRYLDIVCQDASGHEAFDVIGGEIATCLETDQPPTAKTVAKVLAKWRRFWSQQPRVLLSPEEQLGLFAEVWFLAMWLIPRIGARDAVARWRGPLGSRHDFEWTGRSVEVKATTSTRGRIHCINGLDQLQPPEGGDLLFFSLRLREEGGGRNTLPSLVAACRGLLEGDAEAADTFDHLLAHVGYSPAHEQDYAERILRIVEEGLFRVDGDFPRLTSLNFPTGVPPGVERVEYEINLIAAGSHLLATSTDQSQEI